MKRLLKVISLEHSPEKLDIIPIPDNKIRVAWGEGDGRCTADVIESEFVQLMCLYGKLYGTPSKMGCRGMTITPVNNEVYNKTDKNIIEFFGEKDIVFPISTETLLLLTDRVRRIKYDDSFWFRLQCAFSPNKYY